MNILIIDDEPLILNTVHGQIKKMELKLDIIDTAGSAEEARKKMEKTYYDIFLCDIVMPVEDGISFARWVLGQYPNCKFIFLTAHVDFEYMKEAISLRSFDYVLQPAGKEELQSVVERAMMQISIERKNRALIDAASFYSMHEMDILDGNAMRYLTGLTKDDSFIRRLVKIRVGKWNQDYLYFPFLIQVLKANSPWEEEERALLRSIYYNIIDEIMAPLHTQNIVILRNDKVGNFIALILFDAESVSEQDKIQDRLENMRVLFKKLLKMEIAVYCGDFCNFEQLRNICGQLLEEQKNNVRCISRLYQVGQISGLSSIGHSLEAKISSWKVLLNQNHLLDFRDSLLRFMDYYFSGNDVNREIVMKLHQNVSEMILNCMASMNISSSDVFDDKLSYYDFMYCWKQADEMKATLKYVIERLYALSGMPDQDVIQSTIRYIRQNIDSDIMVSELAARVGRNPEYLTRIFKKSTGYSLKKFIDMEKMEVAKLLLTTTNLPVTSVSGHAGYANYSNFTRSFKQIVGYTPSEYRELNKPDQK